MTIEVLIKYLVDSALAFRDSNSGDDLQPADFAKWLLTLHSEESSKGILNMPVFEIDTELIAQIGRLGRYGNSYLKMALSETPFVSIMDFPFCAMLQQYGPMGKSALIKLMVYEKSSGMEIIKRLLRLNLIEQKENPKDGRSKLLNVSPEGHKALQMAYKTAGVAAKIVSGPLTLQEKGILLNLLKKLDGFHEDVYHSGETDLQKIADGLGDTEKSDQ
ncbi:MAG: winged helix DNA-binding protein [Bacteroidota bacterium]